MESFYGGRKGISFIISKKFDGIDIPEKTVRTGDYYATDVNGKFLILHDAPIVRTPYNQDNPAYIWRHHLHDGSEVQTGTGIRFKDEWAQGMVQFFAKGPDTTAEVGYGEYVIIDTIAGLHNYNAMENGIVYRRGMDYQQKHEDDILKPGAGAEYVGQVIGPQGETPIVNIDTISNIKADSNFNKTNSGEGVSEIVSGKDTDEIKFAWVEMLDIFGNNIGVKLGFTFPYTVFNFTAKRTDAYTDPKFSRLTSKDGGRPFYYEWQLTVPEGKHGTDAKNFRIDDSNVERQVLVYDEVDYTNKTPKTTTKEIGDWRTIKNISLKENGSLTVDYTNGANDEFPNMLQWINKTKGIQLADDGTVTVTYNTGAKTVFQNALTWITSLNLDQNGTFKVTYNNDKIPAYNTILRWIEEIRISPDGSFSAINNTGDVVNFYEKYLKVIKDIQIDNGTIEGDGTQKVTVTYNTGEVRKIGKGLNYIMETVVTDPETAVEYGTKPFHMLVLYSDSTKRGNVSYYSETFGKVRNDWKDLGYVRGEAGVLRIIGNFDTESNLKNADGGWLTPPEVEGYNPERVGWGYTVGERFFYLYDYNKKIWYNVGGIATNPKNIIVAATDESAASEICEGGFWMIVETNDSVN